jgi:hypothetical protein
MIRLLFLLLLLVSTTVGARMYQWQDPNSKSVQFSGVPPAWYRSPGNGPRVRVYEGGQLVDDTYIHLSPEDDKSMREIAFRALEEEEQLEAIKRLERAARREDSRREQEQREALKAQQASSERSDTTESPPEVLPESLTPEMVDRLKSIISGYDRANDNRASQATVESPPSAASGVGTSPAPLKY